LVALLAKEIVPAAVPLVCGLNRTENDALCPEASVSGNDRPLRANSELLELLELTVTLEPLAVSVPERLWLAPTVTLPKVIVVGFTASCPGLAPLPESGIDTVALLPFEEITIDPEAAPLACGANATLNVRLCPAFSVVGTLMPVMVNPAPLAVTCEMLTVDPPELVNVSDFVRLAPSCTAPKSMLAGFAPTIPGVTPTPDIGTLSREFVAVLVIAILPVTLPLADGANVTEKLVLWPAARVTGRVRPLTLNPDPLATAWVTVTLEPVPLVRLTVWGWFTPT
jgi:hypothetical protein